MRAWEPGDVAMVVCSDGEERRAIIGTRYIDDSPVFVFRDGKMRDPETTTSRPLVVIDPEDREQMLRLGEAYAVANDNVTIGPALAADRIQRALREFADPKPPKPAEPTGLGAVIEDSAGELWVRDKTTTTTAHWKRARGQMGGKRVRYADIDVVTVLSEGVTR